MIPQVALMAAVTGLIGVVMVAARHYERRRREALSQYCLMRGYRFEPDRRGAEATFAEELPVFRKGRSRRWGATLSGRMGGQDFTAFEYTYVTGGGNSNNRHHIAGVLWERDGARLPRFSCVPENVLYRLGQHLGMQDFDFDDDPEFSRAYQLQGQDEAAVRALFTRRRRALLTASGPDGAARPTHHLAGAGPRLFWWRNGRLPRPEALDQFLADGDRLRREFLDTND
jgi:hypothetical protein